MAKRIEQVNELVKEVVAGILLREVQFPDGVLVTVTRVVTSPDLHYADVFVTVFSSRGEDAQKEVLETLKKRVGEVQHGLNKSLRMRPVPRILFRIDDEEMRRERVEELLGKQ